MIVPCFLGYADWSLPWALGWFPRVGVLALLRTLRQLWLLLLLRAPEIPSVCLPLLAGLVALFGAQLCPTATFVGVYFLCNLATFLDNLAVTRMVWNRHCLCDLLGGCPRCLLGAIFVPFCARFGV